MSSSYQEPYQYVTQDYSQYQPSVYSYQTSQSSPSVQYSAVLAAGQYPGQSAPVPQYSETSFSSSLQYADQASSSDRATNEQYASVTSQAYSYGSSTSDYYSHLQQVPYPGSYKTTEHASGNRTTFEYNLGARQAASTQATVQYPYGDVHSAGQQADTVDSYISSGLSTTPDGSNSYSSQILQSTTVSTPFASQQNQHTEMQQQSPLSGGQAYGGGLHNYTGAGYSVPDSHIVPGSNSSYSSASQIGYSDNTAVSSEDRPYGPSSSLQESFSGFSNDHYHATNDTTNKYAADPFYRSGSERQQFWMQGEQYSQVTSADECNYNNRCASQSEPLAQAAPESRNRGCVSRPRNNPSDGSLHRSIGPGTFPRETGYVQSEGQGKGNCHQEPWQYGEKYSGWAGSSKVGGRAGLKVNWQQKGQQQRGRGRGGGSSHAEEQTSFHASQPFDSRRGSSLGPRGFAQHRMTQPKERTVSFPQGGFQGGRTSDFRKFGDSQNQTRFSGKSGFGSSQMLEENRQQDARRSGSNSESKISDRMAVGGGGNRSQGLNPHRAKISDVGQAQNKRDSVPLANKGTQKGGLDDVEDKSLGKGSLEKQALVPKKSGSGNPLPGDKISGANVKDQVSKAGKTGQTLQTKSVAAQSAALRDKHESSIRSVDSKSLDSHHSNSSTSLNDSRGAKAQVSSSDKTASSSCSLKQESGKLEVREPSSSAPSWRKDDAVPKKKDDAVPKKKDDAVPKKKDDAVPKKKDDAVPKKKDDAVPKKKDDAVPKKKSDDLVHREKILDEGNKDELEKKDCGSTKPEMTKEEIEREEEIQRKIRESVVALVVLDQPTEEDIQSMFDPPPSVEVPDHLLPKLKALLTQTRCDLCSLTLNAVQQAVQHYKGKNHAKRVRLFVSSNGNYSAAKVTDNSGGATAAATVDATKTTVLASASLARPGHSDSEGSSGATTVAGSEAENPGEEKKQASGEERECSKDDYCGLCGVSFTSIKQSEQHYSGKNHAKKQRMADASKLMAEIADSNLVKKGENNVYECTICNVFVTSHEQFSTHIKGFKHLNKLRQVEGREHPEKPLPFGRGRGPFRGRLAHGGGRGGGRGAMQFGRGSVGGKRAANFSCGREQDRQSVVADRGTRDRRGSWNRGRPHSNRGAAQFFPAVDYMREDFQRNSFESREHKDERFSGSGIWEGGTWGGQGHLMAPDSMPASGLEESWGQGDGSRPFGGKRTGTSLKEFGGPRGKRPRRGF